MKPTPVVLLLCLSSLLGVPRSEAGCRGVCGAVVAPTNAVTVALTPVEKRHLLLMQDEEKLARDVYHVFAETWELRPFVNIGTRSEPAHLAAITGLLQRHQAGRTPQPAGAGEFRSPRMKKLYDSLVKTGSVSALDALKVAVEIEELDIKDLREGAARTRNEEIKAVYASLEAASVRHLNAFLFNLKARNGAYTPKHLDEKTFNGLIRDETAQAPAPAGRRGPRGG